jgi:hypothetical protein
MFAFLNFYFTFWISFIAKIAGLAMLALLYATWWMLLLVAPLLLN